VEDEDDEPDERRTTGPARELWGLRDVNLVVQRSEAVGVVSPTGSGKSRFAQGDERARSIALSPYVVDLCGRHLLQARVTLEGVIPGDYVGNAGVIANHSDGRVSEFLRSEAFRLSIERPEEDDGQRSDRPTVSWTVLNLPDDSVAATSAT
jgi:hypothetical protein